MNKQINEKMNKQMNKQRNEWMNEWKYMDEQWENYSNIKLEPNVDLTILNKWNPALFVQEVNHQMIEIQKIW